MSGLGLPMADRPEEIGLSPERLERIRRVLRRDVERRVIPGAVMVIARGGRIGFAEACGYRDREAGAPMTMDAIFRVASMTKPVTSVAAMMLAEQGELQISAPVAEYLPELKERTVGVERVRARRTMTVQDLLRHTSGLPHAAFGDTPVQMICRKADLMNENQTNAELVAKLAALPLMFEPGTTWEYSMSTDVLGRVVEVVSGKSLAEFFAQHICGPLGMSDTAFAAPAAKAARVAEPQQDNSGVRPPMREVTRPHRWASGGGGRLPALLPDAVKWRRTRRGAVVGAQDRAPYGRQPSAAQLRLWRDRARTVWRARPGAGDGLRLWPRILRAPGGGPLAGAGLGRRILLGRGDRHLFLDRSGRRPDRDLSRPGSRPPALLPR